MGWRQALGLSTYTFRDGVTYELCKHELINYLVHGIEPAEFLIFAI